MKELEPVHVGVAQYNKAMVKGGVQLPGMSSEMYQWNKIPQESEKSKNKNPIFKLDLETL